MNLVNLNELNSTQEDIIKEYNYYDTLFFTIFTIFFVSILIKNYKLKSKSKYNNVYLYLEYGLAIIQAYLAGHTIFNGKFINGQIDIRMYLYVGFVSIIAIGCLYYIINDLTDLIIFILKYVIPTLIIPIQIKFHSEYLTTKVDEKDADKYKSLISMAIMGFYLLAYYGLNYLYRNRKK